MMDRITFEQYEAMLEILIYRTGMKAHEAKALLIEIRRLSV